MAEKVVLHIGLPKTGTTYLQKVLWANRDVLRAEGVLLPGFGHREHLWAALSVQGRKNLARRHPDAPDAWPRLVRELRGWSHTGLISHEFFSGAGAEAVQRVLTDLAPAEVHVVVTARDALAMLSAGWQELVKNGGTLRPDEASATGAGRAPEFSWRTWDLAGVLERWGATLPPERVHVLVLPGPGQPPTQHWSNFAATVGLGGDYTLPERPANQSLGVVQVELLRRINGSLSGFGKPVDRGTWIRGHLAEQWLAQQGGEPFGIPADLVAECRERSRRSVELVRRKAYDVVGDLDSLVVPDEVPARRTCEEVTEAELVTAAADLVAVMLSEVRERSRELAAVRRSL